MAQTFSLRDTYGAGVRDRQLEDLRGERIKGAKRSNAAADLFKQTAQQAMEGGQYSPAKHASLLEQAGHPQAAQELRTGLLQKAERGYEFLQHSLPFLNEQTWPAFKRNVVDAGLTTAEALPDEYDPKFVAQLEQRLVGQLTELYGDIEQVAEGPGGAAIFGQRDERTGKLANVTTIKPPASSAPDAPSGYRFAEGGDLEAIPGGPADKPQGGALKAADSNSIFRQAASLFGGQWDPVTGRFSGLEKDQAVQAQNIAARASEIYASEGVPHAVAVQQAFNEMAGGGAPAPQGDGPVQIQTAEDYAALPPGAEYIDPNGQRRTKAAR